MSSNDAAHDVYEKTAGSNNYYSLACSVIAASMFLAIPSHTAALHPDVILSSQLMSKEFFFRWCRCYSPDPANKGYFY